MADPKQKQEAAGRLRQEYLDRIAVGTEEVIQARQYGPEVPPAAPGRGATQRFWTQEEMQDLLASGQAPPAPEGATPALWQKHLKRLAGGVEEEVIPTRAGPETLHTVHSTPLIPKERAPAEPPAAREREYWDHEFALQRAGLGVAPLKESAQDEKFKSRMQAATDLITKEVFTPKPPKRRPSAAKPEEEYCPTCADNYLDQLVGTKVGGVLEQDLGVLATKDELLEHVRAGRAGEMAQRLRENYGYMGEGGVRGSWARQAAQALEGLATLTPEELAETDVRQQLGQKADSPYAGSGPRRLKRK